MYAEHQPQLHLTAFTILQHRHPVEGIYPVSAFKTTTQDLHLLRLTNQLTPDTVPKSQAMIFLQLSLSADSH